MFGLKLITPPAAEPVSLVSMKSYLRVDTDNEDPLIGSLITAARQYAEKYTGRAFFDQTWTLTLDHFPYFAGSTTLPTRQREDWLAYSAIFDQIAIRLPKPALVSVSSITFQDGSGIVQTLPASAYSVDLNSQPARIVPASGSYWPTAQVYVPGSVAVTYGAGSYGDGITVNNCPQSLCMAIMLLVGQWYAYREAVSDGPMTPMPLAVNALLDTERLDVFSFGNN